MHACVSSFLPFLTYWLVTVQFILPYLLGWHAFANSIKPEETSLVNSANPRYGGDFEWSR